MKHLSAHNGRRPEMIRVLTFDFMGVRMGVDTEQVAEVMNLDEARKRGQTLHHLNEKISFGKRQVAYEAPKALLIKEGGLYHTVIIDNLDDIVAVPLESIQPMPPLLALRRGAGLFWGAVADSDGIVLLADFTKMDKNDNFVKSRHSRAGGNPGSV